MHTDKTNVIFGVTVDTQRVVSMCLSYATYLYLDRSIYWSIISNKQ